MRSAFYSFCLSCFFLFPLSGTAVNLNPANVQHEGFFTLPDIKSYRYGSVDISMVPDCMGAIDPSPDDGYPGCLLHATKAAGAILTDIPVPTMNGAHEAITVIPEWDLMGNMPASHGYSGHGGGSEEPAGLYYEAGEDCRIWWTYMHEYANSPFNDDPLLGYTDCSATNPKQTGMWMLDQSSGPEYRVTSWAYNITRVPQEIADDYFEGKSMAFGPGKSTGTRGSSLGPSVGVRPWNVPDTAADNFTPILYYFHDLP